MASETKVGLIAGLTFIICFAIVLANRSTRELTTQSEFRIAGPRGSASGDWQIESQSPPGQSSPARTVHGVDTRSPQAAAPTRTDRMVPPTRRPARRHGIHRGTHQAPGPELERTTMVPAEQTLPRFTPGTSPDHATSADARGTSLSSTSPNGESRLTLLERRLDELAEDLQSAGRSTTVRVDGSMLKPTPAHTPKPASSAPTAESHTPRSLRYTVVSGDTLSKIAASYYGRRSARFVKVVFDANRSVLSSPHELRPGMELVIPSIEGATPGPSARSSARRKTETPRPPQQNRQEAQLPVRWYQIKQNDRYVTIAREQLGDVGRWPEIHELNKDKFPNPQQIRAGVRIRLPVKALAASSGRRR